jgi:YbbR domain-containing protein
MGKLKYIKPISLQLLSVTIAFFLWLYVLSSADTKVEKFVNVHFVLPDGYAIVNKPTSKIKYYLNGPRALVRSFTNKKDHINLNIKNIYTSTKNTYEFSTSQLGIKFPFGVNVESVEPKMISVNIEKKSTKIIPIKLQTIGDVPSDHKMMQWTLVPSSIKISGPKSLMENVTEVKSMVTSISGLTQSGSKILDLISIDERLSYSQANVDYQYEIQPTRANMILKKIPIRFLSTKVLKGSDRRFVNLMVLAENGMDFNLKKEKIKVIAEVPDNAKGKIKVKLKANLPDGIHLLEIMPSEINITINNSTVLGIENE